MSSTFVNVNLKIIGSVGGDRAMFFNPEMKESAMFIHISLSKVHWSFHFLLVILVELYFIRAPRTNIYYIKYRI